MESHHPGSASIEWFETAEKDKDGYSSLSSLATYLKDRCGIEGQAFIKHVSSDQWREEHGWRLKLHTWKPNKVTLEKEGEIF